MSLLDKALSKASLVFKEIVDPAESAFNSFVQKYITKQAGQLSTINKEVVDSAVRSAEDILGTKIIRVGNTSPTEDAALLLGALNKHKKGGMPIVYGHAEGLGENWRFIGEGQKVSEYVKKSLTEYSGDVCVVACDTLVKRNFSTLESVVMNARSGKIVEKTATKPSLVFKEVSTDSSSASSSFKLEDKSAEEFVFVRAPKVDLPRYSSATPFELHNNATGNAVTRRLPEQQQKPSTHINSRAMRYKG